jgi:hypothetical protein
VLKITRVPQEGGTETIKLEGEILEPWVVSIHDACTEASKVSQCALDLAAGRYVDPAGIGLLRNLLKQGFEITACSSYVGALLDLAE